MSSNAIITNINNEAKRVYSDAFSDGRVFIRKRVDERPPTKKARLMTIVEEGVYHTVALRKIGISG